MNREIHLDDIRIRTELRAGDIGYVIYLHGLIYEQEYRYGTEFEAYVALGLVEFYKKYDPEKDKIWVCEHCDKIVGFLLALDRGDKAQLRFFIIDPAYRGVGLGKRLMNLFMDHLRDKNYQSCYLLTTDELPASAHLYKKFGFKLTSQKPSDSFGRPVTEQRYDWTANQ